MPILVAGSQGEWALYENTLNGLGADDRRVGSVRLVGGQQMFRAFAGTTDMWVHVRMAANRDGANTGGLTNIQIRDVDNNILAGIFSDGFAGSAGPRATWRHRIIHATDAAGGTTTANSEQFDATPFEFFDWDFHVQISTVTNPNDTLLVEAFRNGQRRLSETITDASGFTVPTNLLLQATQSGGNNLDTDTYYQDVVISDTLPTVGMELAVLDPNAVGFYSDFNNDYQNIDEDGYDPNDLISTINPTDKESWTFAAPSFILGDKIIYAVAQNPVAQLDLDANLSDFRPFLRQLAVDHLGNLSGANNITPNSYIMVWEQNPSTTQPWLFADLATLEAGIEAL